MTKKLCLFRKPKFTQKKRVTKHFLATLFLTFT